MGERGAIPFRWVLAIAVLFCCCSGVSTDDDLDTLLRGDAGPVIPAVACYDHGGLQYLKKYRESVAKYTQCVDRSQMNIINNHIKNNGSNVELYCSNILVKFACFGDYIKVVGPCVGDLETDFHKSVVRIANKTVSAECAKPEKISFLLESGALSCLSAKKIEIAAKCAFDEVDREIESHIKETEGLLYYAKHFMDIFNKHSERICGFMARKLDCALPLLRDCGNETFTWMLEIVTNIISSNTLCTYDTSHVMSAQHHDEL